MIDVGLNTEFARYESRIRTAELIDQAAAYRNIAQSAPPSVFSRLLELIGENLIRLGRRMCEKHGQMVVEIEFHPSGSPNGRHAA